MQQLKSAIERLDKTIDTLENRLDARLTTLESGLRDARAQCDAADSKAKNASAVGARLDQVIDELTSLLSTAAPSSSSAEKAK